MRWPINQGSPKKPIRLRNCTLENLSGRGGGEGESTNKILAQGKIKRKEIHVCQLSLKIFLLWPKKTIHTRNLITKKNSCGSNIPPPPP